MVVDVKSMGLFGMDAYEVNVETDISRGMSSFDIVGLPDISIKEARDRVKAAIRNSGFEFPLKKVIVNLAPADIKKSGSLYDLPILMSILLSAGALNNDISDCAFIGELSLSGDTRAVNGILPMAIEAKKKGIKKFFVPAENSSEGAVVDGIEIMPVRTIAELVMHFRGRTPITPAKRRLPKPEDMIYPIDFSEVRGQTTAKRALEIAACGGHNVLFIGSPGAGKSMLAKRLPTILPDMTFDEMIEATKIHSIAGTLPKNSPLLTHRPFRSPHHTVSPAGLSGGGAIPHPGEISLAHHGVLFLDELPEFSRNAMEILRQPIEDGQVTISRVNATLTYPCSVMLVTAMNPCPCGYFGHPTRKCTCSKQAVAKYLSKVSGPLLDRLDLHVEVPPVEFEKISHSGNEECSAAIKARVNKARMIQTERYKGTDVTCNARMTPAMQNEFCPMDDSARLVIKRSFDSLGFSARAYGRIVKVARTIADMDNSEVIRREHIFEAVQFRSLDRKYWNN